MNWTLFPLTRDGPLTQYVDRPILDIMFFLVFTIENTFIIFNPRQEYNLDLIITTKIQVTHSRLKPTNLSKTAGVSAITSSSSHAQIRLPGADINNIV